jgi:hypothetical protein
MKKREDFVLIRPAGDSGESHFTCGNLEIHCAADRPVEVTRGEWDVILKPLGIFELCPTNQEA